MRALSTDSNPRAISPHSPTNDAGNYTTFQLVPEAFEPEATPYIKMSQQGSNEKPAEKIQKLNLSTAQRQFEEKLELKRQK